MAERGPRLGAEQRWYDILFIMNADRNTVAPPLLAAQYIDKA